MKVCRNAEKHCNKKKYLPQRSIGFNEELLELEMAGGLSHFRFK